MTARKPKPVPRPNYSMSKNQPESPSPRHYHAYLLRFWQEAGDAPWRFQLEHPQTREVLGFSSLEQLVQFLDGHVSAGEKAI
jgi:hypothetical protein